MIIDKKLEKAIVRESRTGLTVYCGGEEIAFVGSDWMARTTMERLKDELRGTLGTLVEMLGFIPEEGSLRIQKAKDKYVVQKEMEESAAASIGTFLSRETVPAKPTALSYGWAWRLWQTEDGKLWGQQTERLDDGKLEAVINGAGCLVIRAYDTGEEQYIRVNRPDGDMGSVRWELWGHLEGVMWTNWEDGHSPGDPHGQSEEDSDDGELDGQMEL